MFLEASFLGLSTGAYCLFSCSPVLAPFFISQQAKQKIITKMVCLFLGGRLAGYLLFGLLAGLTGNWLNQELSTENLVLFKGCVSVVVGLLLIASGLRLQFPHFSICKLFNRTVTSDKSAFLFGILTGVNLCPPFIGAATRIMNKGGVLYGAGFFLIFFLTTSLYFLPYIGITALTKRKKELILIARFSMLIIGAYILLFSGVFELISFFAYKV